MNNITVQVNDKKIECLKSNEFTLVEVDVNHVCTDELVYLYEQMQEQKDYTSCDLIRNSLDSRGSFIYGSYKQGVQVYHLGKGYTREQVNKEKWYFDEVFKGREQII